MSDPNNPRNIQPTQLDESLYPAPRPAPARPAEKTELLSDDAPPAPMAWLINLAQEGSNAGQMYRLQGRAVTLGRGEDCEIMLDDRSVSRQHARLKIEGSGDTCRYMLHDLATDNGTFVNGQRISSAHELQPNEIIRLGRSELIFKRI